MIFEHVRLASISFSQLSVSFWILEVICSDKKHFRLVFLRIREMGRDTNTAALRSTGNTGWAPHNTRQRVIITQRIKTIPYWRTHFQIHILRYFLARKIAQTEWVGRGAHKNNRYIFFAVTLRDINTSIIIVEYPTAPCGRVEKVFSNLCFICIISFRSLSLT